MKKLRLIPALLVFCILGYSQVGIGTNDLDESAILDVSSSSSPKAFKEAVLQPILVSDSIVGVNILDPGYGYEDDIKICIYGNGGSGAEAVATVTDGVISNITMTAAGSGYDEAFAIAIKQSKAMLFSRVNINDVSDTVNPINNPHDGLLTFNDNDANNPKGFYYFNGEEQYWERGLTYPETPKTFFINFRSNIIAENEILNNTPNGQGIYLGDPSFINNQFRLGRVALANGVRLRGFGGLWNLYFPPGKYLIQLNFTYKALVPDNTATLGLIGNSDYQYNGIYYDMFFYPFDESTNSQGTCIPISASGTGCRWRKEAGTLVKAGEYFTYTQYFVVDLPENFDNPTKYFVKPFIGRMSGSTIYDSVLFDRNLSYIKVLKY